MLQSRVIFFVSAVLIGFSNAAKILGVFPTPSISHQVVFRAITHELARRGHEVTVITTDPVFSKDEALKNLTEIDVHDISYNLWSDFIATAKGSDNDIFNQMSVGFMLGTKIVEVQLKSKELSQILKKGSDYFDLLIVEAVSRPSYVFTHLFKAPAVLVSSFGAVFDQFEVVGVPGHHILYPSVLRQKLTDLTIWEKFYEVYRDIKLNMICHDYIPLEDEMLRRNLGPDVPSVAELRKNFDMFFLNEYPIWDSNRPVPPNVVYMGGLHQKQPKELPKDLKKYLDDSTNGVIYISFGTNVSPSVLPAEKINLMVNVFSKLPYNVLWKWDKDVLPGQTKNIRIGKWFPQSDLLRHPNVKLFITQGGLQSTDEAITAGVPLLGMPMLGDQWFNVERYISLKIGQRLDMEQLTEEKFKHNIESIINDKSYRDNIKDLQIKMKDQPMSPLDRTIWWMEYVIRHKGARHLRSPLAGISWSEYLELPLVFTLLSIVLAALLTVVLSVAYAYRLLFSKSSKVKNH